jgi:hypothetical protein
VAISEHLLEWLLATTFGCDEGSVRSPLAIRYSQSKR